MAYTAKRNPKRCPTHPGALLRDEIIPATGRTKVEIASLLGISRQHLYDILNERKPVSPAVAVRLGKLFGDGAPGPLASQAKGHIMRVYHICDTLETHKLSVWT